MPTITEINKEFKNHILSAKNFKLVGDEKETHEFFIDRKKELQEAREKTGIEKIWKSADKAYIPHEAETKGTKATYENEELGMRSNIAIFGTDDDWKETSIPPNVYTKIQTGLAIIVDRNPQALFEEGAKKYRDNTLLIENLYQRSWEISKSKNILLKPFVLNLAKYGMGVGRTFYWKHERKLRNGEKIIKYNDVFRESLNPLTVWFDDASIIGNVYSTNDVMYYKDYSWDKFQEEFYNLDNFKYVIPEKKGNSFNVKVWFYENLARDLYYIETDNGIPLLISDIPKEKARNKRLSVWYGIWSLRDDKSIYGIGIYEAMKNDHKLYTKWRAMGSDQLTQSIYKEFFYEGTDELEADGIMRTSPGQGRQMVNPQNMRWNEIPGPGRDYWQGLEFQEKQMQKTSGITDAITGEITGKTAFEVQQSKESALKRLKTPLENITDSLEIDAYITIGCIEENYTIPKIKHIGQDRFIEPLEAKLMIEKGEAENMDFQKEFRELPLKLEIDKKTKQFKKTEKTEFFSIPENLEWEGVVKVIGQSIIADSSLLDRTTTLEMANQIIPLFSQPRELVEKPIREIIKKYDKDPADWLPDEWLLPPQSQEPDLFINQEQQEQEQGVNLPAIKKSPQQNNLNTSLNKILK